MSTQEFLQDYFEEVQEHLLDMEKSLLLLEQEGADQEQIAQVFRAAHSIKGASTYMGFEGLAALTHELESLISSIRQDARAVPSEAISLLLKCVDLIARSVEHVKQKGVEPPQDPAFVEQLRRAFAGEVFSDRLDEADAAPGVEGATPRAASGPEGQKASQSPIEEEDEELLAIFISSFRENYAGLLGLLGSSESPSLHEGERETALELAGKMIASAQYMDYQPVISTLEGWEKALRGAKADALRRRELLESLEACARQLDALLPELALSSPAQPEADPSQSIQNEEDEELLAIFISSFQENYSQLLDLLHASGEAVLGDAEIEAAREAAGRMTASAEYMDYQPVAALLSELREWFERSGGRGLSRPEALQRLKNGAGDLERMIPGLKISPSVQPEPSSSESAIHEEDEELYEIFLGSFQQNFTRLAEIAATPSPGGEELERASEITGNLVQSSQYMDYQQVVELLGNWEDALNAFKAGNAAPGELVEHLSVLGAKLGEKLPGFQAPDLAMRPPEQTPMDLFDAQMDSLFRPAVEPFTPEPPGGSAGGGESGQPLTPPPGLEGAVSGAPSPPVASSPLKEPGRDPVKKERTVLVTEDVPHHSTTLRVDARKVDQLLNQVGELVVTRSEFIQTASFFRDILRDLTTQGLLPKNELRRLRLLTFRLNESTQSLGRVANDLQASVMRVRMLPISQLFQRFPRIVRDQALKQGKRVELLVEGGETEIDKRVLEQMNDPIVQFLRNAIVHGIESPEERGRAGKPEAGTIRLAAYHSGDYVAIEIEDDGRGVNTQKLRELLQKRNEASRHELERLSDQEIAYSIFMPGISTYDKVDGSAGRGVGLDVVKENVEHMNGSIEVETQPGQGTRFIIRIPLTVAIIRALLVREADQVFTLPLTSVTEILRYRPQDTHSIEGFQVITLRGKTIPLVNLRELLHIRPGEQDIGHRFVVIVSTSFREVGLVVDGLLGEREVVIKSIENGLQPIEGFSGATILGDGRVSLIVDVSALLKMMKSSLAPQRALKNAAYAH